MAVYTVKLGIKGLTPASLVEKGRTLETACNANANFTLPITLLPAILAACTALEAANKKVLENGGKSDHLIRRQRYNDLALLIKDLGGFIQGQSGGDLEKINSAAFEVRKAPTPAQVPNVPGKFEALLTRFEGAVKLRWLRDEPIQFYQVEMLDKDGVTWLQIGTTTKSTFTHMGLASGQNYTFRIYAVNAAGAGPLSDKVTVKAA